MNSKLGSERAIARWITYNNLVQLQTCIRNTKEYAFSVDFKSAFDSPGVFYKHYSMGISTECIHVLDGLNSSSEASAWTKQGLTERIKITVGLKGGCVLSPALYVDNLAGYLGGGIRL